MPLPPSKSDASEHPEQVGPYLIESHIGSGGMGEVFRAYDDRLDRRVALKQIKRDAARHPQLRKRFLREARAAAKLSHPTVVQVHDILHHDGCDWIVMELAEGRSLRDILRTGPLALGFTLELAVELASGLTFAHEHGIVHRDLKSDNVVLTPQGRAKILDFGLAKDLFLEDSSVSKAGQLIGTPRCMSPEQATGRPVDHRSDLFSFGILLYEMLTGESPFGSPSPLQSVTKVCSHDPPAPSSIVSEIPEELDRLILWLLEKERDDRPPGARIVLAELQRITGQHFQGSGDDSAGSGYTPTFLPPASVHGGELDRLAPHSTQPGRTSWVAATAVALVLAAVAVAVLWWAPPSARDSAPPDSAPPDGAPGETSLAAAGLLSAVADPTPPADSGASPAFAKPAAGPASDPSVAVLPFVDLGNGRHPYFADAVADELGQRLPDLPELRVVSRWSTDEYAGESRSPYEIGEELGVAHLLRGRVFWGQSADGGEKVRVEVDLVRCADGKRVWSSTFGRDVEDLFQAQAQISENVLREVSRVLSTPLGKPLPAVGSGRDGPGTGGSGNGGQIRPGPPSGGGSPEWDARGSRGGERSAGHGPPPWGSGGPERGDGWRLGNGVESR